LSLSTAVERSVALSNSTKLMEHVSIAPLEDDFVTDARSPPRAVSE
jgi:hypothetical protein